MRVICRAKARFLFFSQALALIEQLQMITLQLEGQQVMDIEALQTRFESAYPQDILKWAADTYGDELAVVTSFGPTGIVTLHMLSEIAPDTTVITLDTGLLFPETYELINQVEERFNLNLICVTPKLNVAQQALEYGDALWERNPEQCCQLRKAIPLGEALNGHAAWIAGVRRDQSPQRALTPIISRDKRYGRLKISPLATWTEDMVWGYIRAYELPYNKLHNEGYPSIGCFTCTKAVDGNSYSRAGRWAAIEGKTECGIHVALPGEVGAQ